MSMEDYARWIASGNLARDYLGPPPKTPKCFRCGRRSAACCEGCGRDFCEHCWHRHSHRRPDGKLDFEEVANVPE